MNPAGRTAIAGAGLTPFGRFEDATLGSLATEAVRAALVDAQLAPDDVDAVVFANAAAGLLSGQEMIRGQVALKGTGLKGLPILNTENACASGSSAAHLAWLQVTSGQADVAIAVGAERLWHPDRERSFAAIGSGIDQAILAHSPGTPGRGSPMMAAYARAAQSYAERHGPVEDALAAVAVKNRQHASGNPNAQYREPITVEDVGASRSVAPPLRLLTCSPITDGAAAVVFCRADDVPFGGTRPMVTVEASIVASHRHDDSVVRRAASKAYRHAGVSADDIDVFQLHDACAFAELAQYEEVGLVPEGGAIEAALTGVTTTHGTRPVNTDGGLMSRGHPLGATGLAQLAELYLQLQDRAGTRQVPEAGYGLAVNAGGWMGDDYATATATLLVTNQRSQ